MKIIDTHAHIYKSEYKNDIAEVIDRAQKAGVERILLPNIDIESIDEMHQLADHYPTYCLPMMGMHPSYVDENWAENLAKMKPYFARRKYIAVGEIGIDLYWDKTYHAQQIEAFEEQLRWSIEYNLPVAIHARNSNKEVVESVKRVGEDQLRGVFHSFCTTSEDLQDILELGNFMVGINGIVTFRNSDLSSVLLGTDLSKIIIETDAPYLAPIPYRGKRNESSYTTQVVEKLASIYGVSPEIVGEITTQNAIKLFGL